ncbi:hypothetical protein DFH08DRAFT_810262 [Mycena albidolilacea]|uniref:Uncharacterized protein n=1 Tax=Mycena albidolilacea TaxID=1033008 RepID=A0AAD6ZZD1_9AGAR|nr:hypothetical protein DFH08DRAFT_810262 [Mycena albidolilacea]
MPSRLPNVELTPCSDAKITGTLEDASAEFGATFTAAPGARGEILQENAAKMASAQKMVHAGEAALEEIVRLRGTYARAFVCAPKVSGRGTGTIRYTRPSPWWFLGWEQARAAPARASRALRSRVVLVWLDGFVRHLTASTERGLVPNLDGAEEGARVCWLSF